MKRPGLLALVVALVVLGACGSDDDTQAGGHQHSSSHSRGGSGTAAFGSPGDPSAADRSIAVKTQDIEFDPKEVTVEVGETISFEVVNAGEVAHEFVIGDEAYQEGHGGAMASGGHMHGANASSTLEPGDGALVTWTFSKPGVFQYACHVDQHYQAGMFGTITVEG